MLLLKLKILNSDCSLWNEFHFRLPPYPSLVSCSQSEAVHPPWKKAAHCAFNIRTLVNLSVFIGFCLKHVQTITGNG